MECAGPDEAREPPTTLPALLYTHVALTLAPVILFHVPLWALPYAFRPGPSHTAQGFLQACAQGDTSLEDRQGFFVLGFAEELLFFALCAPFYFLLPHPALPPLAERSLAALKEAQDRVRHAKYRWRWGVVVVLCFAAALVLRVLAIAGFADLGVVYLVNYGLYAAGMLACGAGWAAVAGELGAAYARSLWRKLVLAGLLLVYSMLCQNLQTQAGALLLRHGNVALVLLQVSVGALMVTLKLLATHVGMEPGMLAVLELCVGASVVFNLRLYVFLKDSLQEALVSCGLNAVLGAAGQLFNFAVMKWGKVPAGAGEATAAVVYARAVLRLSATCTAMLALSTVDTRYRLVAGLGYGEVVDLKLVQMNFGVAFGMEAALCAFSLLLVSRAHGSVDVLAFAGSFQARSAFRSFALFSGGSICYTVALRSSCLICSDAAVKDHLCFDA